MFEFFVFFLNQEGGTRGENGSDIIRPYPDLYSDNSGFGYSDTNTVWIRIFFLSDMNTNTIFNFESDTDTNTDNYLDPDIFEIRISG
jgi:hypothetical protein